MLLAPLTLKLVAIDISSPSCTKTGQQSFAYPNLLPTCRYHLCHPSILRSKQKRNNRPRIAVLLFPCHDHFWPIVYWSVLIASQLWELQFHNATASFWLFWSIVAKHHIDQSHRNGYSQNNPSGMTCKMDCHAQWKINGVSNYRAMEKWPLSTFPYSP